MWDDFGRVTDKYYLYIESNLQKGARIDAIGMQFHQFWTKEEEYEKTRFAYNPKQLYKIMDLYAKFNKPLQITEVTIPAYSNSEEDELIQAEIIKKLYSIWFSHPATEQIIYWNLVDGYAHVWESDPEKIKASQGDMTVGENYYYGGLLRFDMTPKPAYFALKNLIEKEWHTEAEITSDSNGKASFKGFYGDYSLQIEANGKTVSKDIKLYSRGLNNFEIVI